MSSLKFISIIFLLLINCNNKVYKYKKGDCYTSERSYEAQKIDKTYGYYHIVINTNPFISCQGEYSNNYWYGCGSTHYSYTVKIVCPSWEFKNKRDARVFGKEST